MHFVALDQSPSSTGFAAWETGEATARSGAWALTDSVARRAIGFVEVHRKLAGIHKERPIHRLFYEQPLKMRSDKVENLISLYGIAAHIESYGQAKAIPVGTVGQARWRATWLGADYAKHFKGTEALKRAAIIRARHLGFDPATHDEAEALGILDYAIHKARIVPPWRLARPFLPTIEI